MVYGDLPSLELCIKMMMCSFESPQKNLEVYKFVKSIKDHQEYFENERTKILEKYGEPKGNGYFDLIGENIEKYRAEFNELAEIKIDGEIETFVLTEDDFVEDCCRYPNDKAFWLSASEIEQIIELSIKLNKERKEK